MTPEANPPPTVLVSAHSLRLHHGHEKKKISSGFKLQNVDVRSCDSGASE